MNKKKGLIFLLLLSAFALLACNLSAARATASATLKNTAAPTSQPSPLSTSPPPASPLPTLPPTASPPPTLSPTEETPEPIEQTVCTASRSTVVLLVDPNLVSLVRDNLARFAQDLCNDGYTAVQRISNFNTPPEARAYLAELYERANPKLEGAIIIGDFPRAYQTVKLVSTNPDIPPTVEEVISFQYYSDLNGNFATSPDYTSPGKKEYSYDLHSGDTNWEVWIGVLPLYKGDLSQTVQGLNRYFEKNHAYRAAGSGLPRAFVEIIEHYTATTAAETDNYLFQMSTGQFSWTPFSTAPGARIYFDNPANGMTVDQGYADLSAGVADFTVTDTHGDWMDSGRLNITWVESNPVKTIFFWSNGCAVGNLDHPDNFLTSILYSPTSMVLIARGTTNDSGGMGNNQNGFFGHNIATALDAGKNFGQAILSHVNVPLVSPWSKSQEFHFASIITLGDPTLKR